MVLKVCKRISIYPKKNTKYNKRDGYENKENEGKEMEKRNIILRFHNFCHSIIHLDIYLNIIMNKNFLTYFLAKFFGKLLVIVVCMDL